MVNKELKNNEIIKESEVAKDIIDSKKQKKKSKKIEKDKEVFFYKKSSFIFHAWFLWRMNAKAKKMSNLIKDNPNRYQEEYRYNWIKKKIAKISKFLDITLDVFGIENWIDQPVVLTPNHQSNFDPVLLLNINNFEKQQVIGFIAKEEIFKSRFGKFADLIDVVPLNRENPRSAHEAFSYAKKLIVEYKRAIVIFPEGTRRTDGMIGEFIPSALKLAQMSNVPIVPVTIVNSCDITIKNRKKTHIKIIFSKPISHQKHLQMKPEFLAKLVQKSIEQNFAKYKDVNTINGDLKPYSRDKKRWINYFDILD